MDISYEELEKKINEMKTGGKLDLSLDEDLSIAVMNLISLEEHFFFTGNKTGKDEYFDHLEAIREMRKELLGRMITKGEGETWCISKHLLAASMRLMEVGTKLKSDKKPEEAKKMFQNAFQLYSLFWAIRLKIVDMKSVSKIPDGALNKHDGFDPPSREATEGHSGLTASKETAGTGGFDKLTTSRWTAEDIVKKLVDCCDE